MVFARTLLLLALTPLVFSLKGQQNKSVDSRLCANCHPTIARTYALTGMARSFLRPDAKNTIENYARANPFYHELSDTWYAMIQRDGGYYQRRWRIGTAGEEILVQELRIDYIMGSGNHARSYLHRTERGTLIELPLGWYPENGGVWAMSPGHDQNYSLPSRTIAYECMFCHNAYPRIPPKHDEPAYLGELPEGIDCQRCHGPGGDHIRAAQAGALSVDGIRKAIVNPARLSTERQMEVCMQCHLETTSAPLPHSIVKYDREPFSYRPGEPLSDFMLFFDRAFAEKKKDSFEITHSVYRLRASRCFLQSKGRLTCTTCHDPHDIPRGSTAAEHFNAKCRNCHGSSFEQAVGAGKHTSEPDCVGCHMPKRRTQDVVHATMTDHLIQRAPAKSDTLAPLAEGATGQYRGEVVPYYPSPLPQTGENALYAAVAQVTQKSNLAKGLPRLAAEVARQKPARSEFYVELGQAWISAGKPLPAVAAFEEAAKRKPDSAVVLLNLGDALTQAGQSPKAVAVLSRAVKAAPEDPLLWYQLGIANSSAGNEEKSIAAFETSVTLDPNLAEAHNLLGAALAAKGDLDRAEQEFRKALEINPDAPDAQGNLGHLLTLRGDLERAVYFFKRSTELKPDDGEVRTNYAVTLARMGRFDESRQQIEAAIKADPKSPEAHNFHGSLLEREGKQKEALAEYLEAVRVRPDFGLAHLNAGLLLAARGERASAEGHLRKAAGSDDAGIRQKATEALERVVRGR